MPDSWSTHDVALSSDALNHLHREWLITNGTGAYAMGTVPGVNTRRYHGLFVAAVHPPVARVVALHQVLEQLTLRSPAAPAKPGAKKSKDSATQKIEFNTLEFHNQNPSAGGDVFAPRGHEMLVRFEKGVTARWSYAWGEVTCTRELSLAWKEQAATVRYVVRTPRGTAGALRLSPMMTLRDFHAVLRKDQAGSFDVQPTPGIPGSVVVRRGDTAVTLAATSGGGVMFTRGEEWWYGVYYAVDAERGQESQEDYFLPGSFEAELDGSGTTRVELTVSLGERKGDGSHLSASGQSTAQGRRPSPGPSGHPLPGAAKTPLGEGERAAHLTKIAGKLAASFGKAPGLTDPEQLARVLAIAADDFVVDRRMGGQDLSTVLAGYPWFADWGRDTFISLPGLMLRTGRYAEAKATLRAFAGAIRDGLVPNRFDDYDENAAHYNTVDGSLWYVHAAIEYVRASGDRAAWDQWLAAACCSILDAYIKGTRYDIRMAGDGLISAGSHKTQLTWMDAACGDRVFTPRPGKAVEINALWFNALEGVAGMLEEGAEGGDFRGKIAHYGKIADRVKRGFVKVFWDDERECLNDHVYTDEAGVDHVDTSLRPNQIFVCSLPRSPLPRTKQKGVVKAVTAGLLTPAGLRTLPENHGAYHPHYTGPQWQRDEAYHQGTIWPWLIGPYAEAVLRVGEFDAASKRAALASLQPLIDRLLGEGLGQLYEVHEAAPPHRPGGCMAQAWSVAEVVRVLCLMADS